MGRRKKNPSTGVILLTVATSAAVVGGLGYAVKARAAKKKKKKKKKGIQCEDGFEPLEQEGVTICVPIGQDAPKVGSSSNRPGKYVGSSGYTSWPHKNIWPNEKAFLNQLVAWGYDPGTSLTSTKGKAAVKKFQGDWNKIAARSKLKHFATIGKDGRIGDQTIAAMAAALGYLDAKEISWQEFVKDGVVTDGSGDGGADIDDDVIFPADISGIPTACLKYMEDSFEKWLDTPGAPAATYVQNVFEHCGDPWDGDDPVAYTEMRTAMIGWIATLGELNNVTDISDEAAAIG